ncbi:uncharacterized protein LOC121303856 isoform X1 [Polyodon spathula]|uniref:uncharacterized protein LOC121303856 isoform X1 n=1 Tax=Polyodon spathula TaxID=7913 RepID=UPI001B7DFD60|nr:uncharacterized protein LOC121303856 isoform X1 [Polyodon spathula]
MSTKRASESQFNSETQSKKRHKASLGAEEGGFPDIIIDSGDDDDGGQVDFCTSFSSKEDLARTFEHAVKVAVKSVMSEMTKLVESKYLFFQVRLDGKEKDIESLKLRMEKAEGELKTMRECMSADKDASSRAIAVNPSRLSGKGNANTLETPASALSRKLKDPASVNRPPPFQKQYSGHDVSAVAAPGQNKVQSAQVLIQPDKAAANPNLFTRVRDCVQIANFRIRHEAGGEGTFKGAGVKTAELDHLKDDATVENLHIKHNCADITKKVSEQTLDSRKRKTFVDPVESTHCVEIPKEVTKQAWTSVTEADPQQGSSQYRERAPEAHSACVKGEPAGLQTVHIKEEPAGLETIQIKEEVPEFEPVNIKEEATELDSLHIIEVPEDNESDPVRPYEDQRQVEDDRTDKATQKQTKWAIKIFKEWLANDKKPTTFEHLPDEEINDLLYSFYPSVKKQTGEHFGKSSLTALRLGINRHLHDPPYSRQLSLMTDRPFLTSNQRFLGLLKQLETENRGMLSHHAPLQPGDFKKLLETGVLGVDNPLALQRYVWMTLALHFAVRTAEHLYRMTKNTFAISVDKAGVQYLHFSCNPTQTNNEARMYAQPGNPMCPLKAYQLYTSKLHPARNSLWQKSNKPKYWGLGLDVWYEKANLSLPKLVRMMTDISRDAKLNRIYTNHCLKETAAVILSSHGVDRHHIMRITTHKNDCRDGSFAGPADCNTRRIFSSILSSLFDVSNIGKQDIAPKLAVAPNNTATRLGQQDL